MASPAAVTENKPCTNITRPKELNDKLAVFTDMRVSALAAKIIKIHAIHHATM